MAVLPALPALSACSGKAGRARLRLASASGNLNLTLVEMLRSERLFERFGVDPEMMDVADGTRILGGIAGGSLDACMMSGIGQVFPAIEKGAELRIIGGAINLPVLALYTSRGDVRSLKDLEGRTVGTGSVGALTWQLTVTLLSNAGVDVSRVGIANIGSSADVLRAVGAGTVDAGAGVASLAQGDLPKGLHAIPGGLMAEALPDFTYAAAWASMTAIDKSREALVRALAAHGALYRLVQSPAGERSFMAARSKVMPKASLADHRAEWAFIQRFKPFAVDLELSLTRLNYLQQLNLGFGIQQAKLPDSTVADMSLAREAKAMLDGGGNSSL